MRKILRALAFALAGFAVVFGGLSSNLSWTYHKTSETPTFRWCGTPGYRSASFWEWVSDLRQHDVTESQRERNDNLNKLAVLLIGPGVIGLAVFCIGIKGYCIEEAPDYADGPTGVSTDGRMVQGG
jgi:hypothetical protein